MSQQRQPKYRFYATLLDAFQWYLTSERDESFQEFIDKINRVTFASEAAAKGTAFNNLVDSMIKGKSFEVSDKEMILFEGFEFPADIADSCADYVFHGTPQVEVHGTLETLFGTVEVYGYIDYLLPAMHIVDLKTGKNYDFPKYMHGWQHIVYPFILNQETGLDYSFTYLATDFDELYTEDYIFNLERDYPRLLSICTELIQFIEHNRHLITDKGIFNEHDHNEVPQPRTQPQQTAAPAPVFHAARVPKAEQAEKLRQIPKSSKQSLL